jgi:hypothetical protein
MIHFLEKLYYQSNVYYQFQSNQMISQQVENSENQANVNEINEKFSF